MNFIGILKKVITEDIPAAAFMLKRSREPFKRYNGSETQIAKKIISECFTGEFFQVSLGHFPQFYMRDFGMCVKSLCELGYTKESKLTVTYALKNYMRENKVSTTIDSKQRCVDFFAYGPDSLAFLLHSIQTTRCKLTESEKLFLKEQAEICKIRVWDSKSNTVRKNTYFSSSKDHYKRNGSCYDFCMLGWISQNLGKLGIVNPFTKINFEEELLEQYWSGEAFYDDLDKDEFSGDAQTFPFYCNILSLTKHKTYFESAIRKIGELKLDSPFPLKYTATRNKKKELFLPSLLAPNYEGDAVWIHTGLCYMEIIWEFDKKLSEKYITAYRKEFEEHKNFLEVYTSTGEPYRSLVYKCDESMLWISMYHNLSVKLKNR